MPTEPRDNWSKFDIAAKAIAAVLIPVVILVVSDWYTRQQKEAEAKRLDQQKAADDTRHDSDRVTLLLTHLASENVRERLLALKFVEYLAQSHQFPEGLLPALISVINDQDEEVSHAASHTLGQVVSENPNLGKSVEQAAQTNSETKQSVEKAVKLNPSLGRLINLSKIRTNNQ